MQRHQAVWFMPKLREKRYYLQGHQRLLQNCFQRSQTYPNAEKNKNNLKKKSFIFEVEGILFTFFPIDQKPHFTGKVQSI